MRLLFFTNRELVKRLFYTTRLLLDKPVSTDDSLMDTRKLVGQRIKQARLHRGLKLRDVCERMPGMSESKLNNYEHGYRMPDLDTFRHLGEVLETSPAYLATLNSDLLNDRERNLLIGFRRLSESQQEMLLSVCRLLSEQAEPSHSEVPHVAQMQTA